MEDDIKFNKPIIIPKYGCCSIGVPGLRCKGDHINTIDINKYCLKCYNYDSNNSIMENKK